MSALARPVDDGRCIGCGPEATLGLHMQFTRAADGSVESRLTVGDRFQGWRDVVHGGIVALLLDEAMAYAAAASGVVGVTGEFAMRFRESVGIDVPLVVRGEVAWRRSQVLGLAASVSDAGGALLATATGRFVTRGAVGPADPFARRLVAAPGPPETAAERFETDGRT